MPADPADRPEMQDIRLDDLASPRLPAAFRDQATVLAALAAEVRLEPDLLIDRAIAETGLDDFGEPGWRTGLEVVLTGLREDFELSPTGVLSGFGGLLQFLKNRLLVEDLLKRHPEILDVEMEPPIVIAGLPRSGTTHLLNLVSADPRLRSLPWWEALEPVLPVSERPAPGEPDPRIARAAAGIEARNAVLPHFDAMHEMTVDHTHEEIHLLAMDFGTMFFENLGVGALPTYRDHYLAEDQTPHYRYLKKVLQALQWLRGGRRWVLKSPQHMEQFGPLMSVFPDATYVIPHRDPVSTVASFSTMIAYTARLSATRVDPVALGHYWADRIETMLLQCTRDRSALPDARSLDVLFHEYMGHELETVERIYAIAGLPFAENAREAMDAYQRSHPRGRFGRVRYDLADFGLDAAGLRERFRPYTDRFPVRLEH
jgi:hypothetical protein